jgi:NAD(P)-dependent dehydrogenase (short-subunit alcohol dehydrogenase family)
MLVGLRTLGDIAEFIEEQGKALEEGRAPALLAAPAPQEANHPFDAAAAAPGPSAAVPAGVDAMSATPAPQRPAAAPAASAAPHGLLRYVFEPQHKGEPCFVLPGLLDADPAYITGHDHLAPALVQALEPYGVRAVAVAAEQVPDEAAVVIALHGLQDDASLAAATAAAREAFLLTARLARHKEQVGGSLVLVQDTGGAFGSDGNQGRALLGGFSSLAKTATFEWPRACVRSIDIERGGRDDQSVANQLAWELLRGGNAFETGLKADGRRLELMPVERCAQRGALPVGREDVLVVTGGARGVTAASIIALARAGQPKLALLGRTALGNDEPAWAAGVTGEAALKKAGLEHFKAAGEVIKPAELNRHVNAVLAQREMHATLQAVQRAGSQVMYLACDVKDPADVGRTLEAIRAQLGPITGIVHGAGVLADKRLVDKKPEHFEAVYTTKVQGLENLLAATQDDPIRLIALFSSVVGRFGNPGQSDYGMANEVLNQIALEEARRRPGCVVKSIGWGAWDSGMVGPALKKEFEKRGLVLIGLDQGAQAFVEELADTTAPAVILSGPIDRSALLAMLERPAMERRFDVLVGKATFPYLDGHRIQGKVVLPFVIAGEWFLRAGRASFPELSLNSVESIRLLKGCILEGFDQQLDRITVVLQPPQEGRSKAQLVNIKGQAFYSAELPMAAVTPEQVPPPPPADNAHPVHIEGAGLYGTELFHTGPFAAIDRITALGPEIVAGSLKGLAILDWPHEDWVTDPLILDGALQVVWMWAKQQLGKVILPSVTKLIVWFDGQPVNKVFVRGSLKRKGSMGVVCTAWFLDEKDQVIAYGSETEGYVMTANWQAVQETAAEGTLLARQAGGD